jgi:uncharacterized membrane protein
MRLRRRPENTGPPTGVGVGLVVASAMVPGTFARSLSARSAVDQGMVTGLSTGLHYLLTVATQDTVQAAAAELAAGRSGRSGGGEVRRQRKLTLAADLAAIPLGLAVRAALPERPGEAMARGLLRQVGWRFAVTGIGASLLIGTETALERLDRRLGAGGLIARLPVAVPVGLGVAFVLEHRRQGEQQPAGESAATGPSAALRPLGIAGAVVGGLALAAYSEHALATTAGRRISAVLPGGPQLWKLTGHAACLGLLGTAGYNVYGRAMRKIEAGATVDTPVIESDEGARWTGRTVSGGPGSLVPWEALGREGRRHALAYVRPEPVIDRPAGVPDLSIETVMGEPAKATPAHIYISLDSAATAKERVELALAEMERTGAFDRSLIVLISPTGTGYVNYVTVAAAAYLTRGDVATVTMQYSKRPSPLSMGKVKDARAQNRHLWLSILERLHERPGPRPRVAVFGESLGAHTSQDAFLHWGTLGPQALGIDRALWIGTPYLSGWMHEVTGGGRLDVDADSVAVVNDYEQLMALGDDRRARLRYVMVSHDNDGVTKFGPDLLTTAPRWLGEDRPRPEDVPRASPRGIPPDMRWRPITTFFQSLIDMKNAQIPGAFRAWAHDYRPDLARFISEVYGLPASPEQMAAVERALEEREAVREQLFSASAATPTEQPDTTTAG